MQYHCSRCHQKFEAPAEADGHGGELRCPACKAEAGLEKESAKTPLPMLLFAGFLAGALLASVVGGAWTLASGG